MIEAMPQDYILNVTMPQVIRQYRMESDRTALPTDLQVWKVIENLIYFNILSLCFNSNNLYFQAELEVVKSQERELVHGRPGASAGRQRI